MQPSPLIDLVGRDHERGEVLDRLDRSRRISSGLVLYVIGEAGIGKTRLAGAVASRAREDGWLTATITCHPSRTRVPFAGVTQLVYALLQGLGERLSAYSSGLEDQLGALDESVARLVGAQWLPRQISPLAIDTTVARLLEGILADHPVLFVIDDAQWLDAESVPSLSYAQGAFIEHPFAVIYAQRSPAANPVASAALEMPAHDYTQ